MVKTKAKKKPPTRAAVFESFALVFEAIASSALQKVVLAKGRDVSPDDGKWFIRHADEWIRWFHANDKNWRKVIRLDNELARDFLAMWVEHWATAFVADPALYKTKHPALDS